MKALFRLKVVMVHDYYFIMICHSLFQARNQDLKKGGGAFLKE